MAPGGGVEVMHQTRSAVVERIIRLILSWQGLSSVERVYDPVHRGLHAWPSRSNYFCYVIERAAPLDVY